MLRSADAVKSKAASTRLSAALNRYRYANQDVTPRPTSSKTPPKTGSLFTASMTPEAAQMATNLQNGIEHSEVGKRAHTRAHTLFACHNTTSTEVTALLNRVSSARGNADGDDSRLLLCLLPLGLDGVQVLLRLHAVEDIGATRAAQQAGCCLRIMGT